MYIMGLNTSAGRLGVSGFKNVYRPLRIPHLMQNSVHEDLDIKDVVIGRDTCMVHTIDYSQI